MNSPRIVKTAGGPEVTETFNANYADAEAAIVARGEDFGDPCPIASGAYAVALLEEIQINKAGPKNAKVVYVWRVPDPAAPFQPVGTETQEVDSNVIEIPIGQHPNADSQNYDDKKKIGIGDWEGIESYLSPQPVYTISEILSSFVFNEDNIIENVASRMTEAGIQAKGIIDGTADLWLKMQLAVSTDGKNFKKTERFQHAKHGWKTNIYDAST